MSLKDTIRQSTIGAKAEYKTKEFTYNGEKVIFKQPSQKVRRDIIEKSTKSDGNVDTVALQTWCVIYLTYDEKDQKVFEQADFDLFMEQPVGSFVDKFAEIAIDLMGNPDEKDGEGES